MIAHSAFAHEILRGAVGPPAGGAVEPRNHVADGWILRSVDRGGLLAAEPETDAEKPCDQDDKPDRSADLIRQRVVAPLVDRA